MNRYIFLYLSWLACFCIVGQRALSDTSPTPISVNTDSPTQPRTTQESSVLLSLVGEEIPFELPPEEIDNNPTAEQEYTTKSIKPWTLLIYMSADNDLAPFARKNLRQLLDIGSTEYINVIVQLDTRIAGNKKVTKRYYIEKDRLILMNQNDPKTHCMDSGSPNTLISFCNWAIKTFPAQHYGLGLWNHGTGSLDIGSKRTINPLPLFLFNPKNNLIELDRSIPFSDFVQSTLATDQKAICFDDSTGHYLSNQDLKKALATIFHETLRGKKFSIIFFDACLMSMIEIGNILKDYADYMVGSQEVELGTGYDYKKVLSPFVKHALDVETFAKHIVASYEQAYSKITNDYTQSAVNLQEMMHLEQNVASVAKLLAECIKQQNNKSVSTAIKTSRHKLFCTHFDEPSYIDLFHFYANLLNNVNKFSLKQPTSNTENILQTLTSELKNGLNLIKKIVVANVAGKNLINAHGISIYLPERRIHSSYSINNFGKNNTWTQFLKTYLASTT